MFDGGTWTGSWQVDAPSGRSEASADRYATLNCSLTLLSCVTSSSQFPARLTGFTVVLTSRTIKFSSFSYWFGLGGSPLGAVRLQKEEAHVRPP